jgi:hypothetical protein
MVAVESFFGAFFLRRPLPLADGLVVLAAAAAVYAYFFYCHFWVGSHTGEGAGFMPVEFRRTLIGDGAYDAAAPAPWFLASMWRLNVEMLLANARISIRHAWETVWWEWIFNLRGLLYYSKDAGHSYTNAIYLLGNPVVIWLVAAGVAASATLLTCACRCRRFGAAPGVLAVYFAALDRWAPLWAVLAYCLCAYAANLAPYAAVARSCFIYHYMPGLMYGELATALLIDALAGRRWMPVAFKVVLAPVVVCFLYYAPWIYLFALTNDGHVRAAGGRAAAARDHTGARECPRPTAAPTHSLRRPGAAGSSAGTEPAGARDGRISTALSSGVPHLLNTPFRPFPRLPRHFALTRLRSTQNKLPAAATIENHAAREKRPLEKGGTASRRVRVEHLGKGRKVEVARGRALAVCGVGERGGAPGGAHGARLGQPHELEGGQRRRRAASRRRRGRGDKRLAQQRPGLPHRAHADNARHGRGACAAQMPRQRARHVAELGARGGEHAGAKGVAGRGGGGDGARKPRHARLVEILVKDVEHAVLVGDAKVREHGRLGRGRRRRRAPRRRQPVVAVEDAAHGAHGDGVRAALVAEPMAPAAAVGRARGAAGRRQRRHDLAHGASARNQHQAARAARTGEDGPRRVIVYVVVPRKRRLGRAETRLQRGLLARLQTRKHTGARAHGRKERAGGGLRDRSAGARARTCKKPEPHTPNDCSGASAGRPADERASRSSVCMTAAAAGTPMDQPLDPEPTARPTTDARPPAGGADRMTTVVVEPPPSTPPKRSDDIAEVRRKRVRRQERGPGELREMRVAWCVSTRAFKFSR